MMGVVCLPRSGECPTPMHMWAALIRPGGPRAGGRTQDRGSRGSLRMEMRSDNAHISFINVWSSRINKNYAKNNNKKLWSLVAHTFNPRTQVAEVSRSLWVMVSVVSKVSSRSAMATWWDLASINKILEIYIKLIKFGAVKITHWKMLPCKHEDLVQIFSTQIKNPDMAHVCDPSIGEVEAGGSLELTSCPASLARR